MPQLNRDILREVFYELVKINGFKSIDKFMMAGKESFELVLDICREANNVDIFKDKIIAQLPGIEYKPPSTDSDANSDDEYYEELIMGTEISTKMDMIKPISIALASTIVSLDLRSFTPALIPMLKSIDREMNEVNIQDSDEKLKDILEACANIPNVQDGVKIRLCSYYDFASGMKSFALPCRKLTIKKAYFNTIYKGMNLYNSHLQNIRDLTIEGRFRKTCTIHKELKEFAAFLSCNFPNLETLNVNFLLKNHRTSYYWNWNDARMANFFKVLPYGIRGSIGFKIINQELEEINKTKYPDVQKNDNEYYKIFPITDTLSFKLAYWYDVKAAEAALENYDYDYSD